MTYPDQDDYSDRDASGEDDFDHIMTSGDKNGLLVDPSLQSGVTLSEQRYPPGYESVSGLPGPLKVL